MDDAFRHAITMMSTHHFATTEAYAARIRQMGAKPGTVFVTGAPSLDNLATVPPMSPAELAADIGMTLEPAPLLVTFHPETLDYANTAAHIEVLLAALTDIALPIVITYPNADTYGHKIIDAIDRFAAARDNVRAVRHLGTRRYFSLMRHAAAMVGNSSSGIIEAASFKLPVVNVGDRQKGRERARNVIDVGYAAEAIGDAIRRAINPSFRDGLEGLENPYGDGATAPRIVARLVECTADACQEARP